jgi:hypothetical protein
MWMGSAHDISYLGIGAIIYMSHSVTYHHKHIPGVTVLSLVIAVTSDFLDTAKTVVVSGLSNHY